MKQPITKITIEFEDGKKLTYQMSSEAVMMGALMQLEFVHPRYGDHFKTQVKDYFPLPDSRFNEVPF